MFKSKKYKKLERKLHETVSVANSLFVEKQSFITYLEFLNMFIEQQIKAQSDSKDAVMVKADNTMEFINMINPMVKIQLNYLSGKKEVK